MLRVEHKQGQVACLRQDSLNKCANTHDKQNVSHLQRTHKNANHSFDTVDICQHLVVRQRTLHSDSISCGLAEDRMSFIIVHKSFECHQCLLPSIDQLATCCKVVF